MATNRYQNTPFFTNRLELYENILEERGVKQIGQYATTTYTALTTAQKNSISEKEIMWQVGDRLDKIASREYGDAQYWWVIARYNNKPTDAHFERGDTVLVPHPLSLIAGYYVE